METGGDIAADEDFCRRLPKAELHAHLTGSISPQVLHEIWLWNNDRESRLDLHDPLVVMSTTKEHFNVTTFFPLFDKYIYKLVNSIAAIRYATLAVLSNFADDGVFYLELRTTPRAIHEASISKLMYVSAVLDAIDDFDITGRSAMETNLILSVDRRQSLDEAMATVELAKRLRDQGRKIVGIDLCGNPAHSPVVHLEPAFALARQFDLSITLHYAEIPASASREELETLLSWKPQRLGHVIHVPLDIQKRIIDAGIAVELCLSCNVLAELIRGGYKAHHFGDWKRHGGTIALSTDDVGVFGSSLSNEYLLAAQNFDLTRVDLIDLARSACATLFGGEKAISRMHRLLDEFKEGKS